MKKIIKSLFCITYPIKNYALLKIENSFFDYDQREREVRWFDTQKEAESHLRDSVGRNEWRNYILICTSNRKYLNRSGKWEKHN